MALTATRRRDLLVGMAAGLIAPHLLPRSADAADEPLRFPHAFGETVLKQPATRVVSIGYTTQDPLLALGVVPVGIRDWFGGQPNAVWPWAQSYLGAAKPVVIKGAVSLEIVAALKPELIVGIGSGITEAEYAGLSKVAPVLMQPKDFPTFGMPWDEMTRLIGRATGRQALAQDLIDKARGQFAALRARHPGWAGKTAVAAYHAGGETGFFTPEDTRGRCLAELGFAPPPAIGALSASSGTFYQKLSPEDLSALEADLLVWVSSFDRADDLAALPMRKVLRAHRQGREVFAGGLTAAAMSFGSVLSLPFVAGQIEADIDAAIDGNPATPVASAVKAGIAP